MDGEFCDCNCGMTDPDCLSGTLEVKYCNKKDDEICSPLGRCTKAVFTAGSIAVSMPCHDLEMPGETSLYGYIGEQTEYEADGGTFCDVCPHDTIYNGVTNKDENNEYVCQYRPHGDMIATEVLAFDANTTSQYILITN